VQYRAGLVLDAWNGPARYNLGGLLRRQGRSEDAVVELREAARLMPRDADAHIELGLALRTLGDGPEALRALRRAIEVAPDTPEARIHLPRLIEEIETGVGAGPDPSP